MYLALLPALKLTRLIIIFSPLDQPLSSRSQGGYGGGYNQGGGFGGGGGWGGGRGYNDRPRGGPTPRPGDWNCPHGCGLVFASKMNCFRCGAPKPEGAELEYGDRRDEGYNRGGGDYGGSWGGGGGGGGGGDDAPPPAGAPPGDAAERPASPPGPGE